MKKTTLYKLKLLFILLTPILFLSAISFFIVPGLNSPEPIGKYLNGKFPAQVSLGEYYVPVFPNITFDSPLSFAEVPGNKIVVGQRDGKIYWFNKSDSATQKNLTLDLSNRVGVVWDGGMMGTVFHPNFGTAGYNYMYSFYSTKDRNGDDYPNSYIRAGCNYEDDFGNYLTLARYTVNPTTLVGDINSEQILIKVKMYGTAHRGGGMQFGDDGFLYVTTGDQGASIKSQDISTNLDGGVLRLDVDQDSTKSHAPVRNMPDDEGDTDEITGNGYWIPNDNPFLSPTGVLFEEYYALGYRSPHRLTKDRNTGKIYIGEIGANRHEEVNVLEKGKNYGWPLYEGLYYSASCVSNLLDNMVHEEPLTTFPRTNANSLIGGYVYRGSEVPEIQGKYICADYGVGEEIWSVNIEDGTFEQLGNFASTDVISFGEDAQGELYILKQGTSSLYKVVSPTLDINGSPELLSETGAFSDLSTLTPTNGLIPYNMIESFWSDGALKQRWMAIPNDGIHDTPDEKINFSKDGDWQFPIGSVLVKHFELPIDERNPLITKRLETRFSIKDINGSFYFLTYKWNDAQTDAKLLKAELDESIPIILANGSQDTQIWHYPNQGQCITCHKTVTGGTLGTRTRYLNSNLTYPKTGLSANQLVTLSHLGILDETITDADTGSYLTHKANSDSNATLDEKARSYLDLNCAYCHRSDAGNRASFDLRLFNSLAETGLFTANPNEPLGIPDEDIIVAGDASKSILYHRINSTVPGIAMPPLAKNKIDEQGAQLIEDWINQLEEPEGGSILPNGLTDLNEGVFYIENKKSGLIIEANESSINDGTNVQQYTNFEEDHQKVRLTKQGNGYYSITFEHSNKAISTYQNIESPGTNVEQNTFTNAEGQLWGFKSEGNGFYQIVSKSSDLFLDVWDGSVIDGANIIIWTFNGDPNQSWKLNPVQTTLSNNFNNLFNKKVPLLVLNENPVSNIVSVTLKNYTPKTSKIQYIIYSISGKQLLSKEGGLTETFKTNNFAKGYYIIKANFDGKSLIIKMIVK